MATPRSVLEDLPFSFVRASLSFRRFNDLTLRSVGVESQAPGLATVLHALEELGDCAVSSLAQKTHLPNGTLTGLLDTLQREGHLRRDRNPEDGRSWIVQLTKSGRGLCAKLHQRHRTVMKIFRETLTEAEAAEMQRLLEKLTDAMRAFAADPDESVVQRPRARVSRRT
ncbi:MAG TPA: MarR family transcriptional regulator [Opitutaceae bacterium]|nr:MarR family transcriptional regulator [Opitutaceae bacterium]